MHAMDDQVLIARARNGDHAAYGALVVRYREAIVRVARRILRNEADAEEAAQEAFVRGYVALDTYDSRFRLYTWLAAIAQNTSFRALRGRDWRISAIDPAVARADRAFVEDGPEISLLVAERDETIRRLVDGLPGKYREVLILRHWHELSYEEIARIAEISLASVKTRLFRARQLLGSQLRQQKLVPDGG